uniref:Uncharacterized protein n=1 Tax=Oryza brachyantha TaxID=4533 RepID=J3M2J1_ORYBR
RSKEEERGAGGKVRGEKRTVGFDSNEISSKQQPALPPLAGFVYFRGLNQFSSLTQSFLVRSLLLLLLLSLVGRSRTSASCAFDMVMQTTAAKGN